jgi:uncharacterized protein with ATP-grasp and redox domains
LKIGYECAECIFHRGYLGILKATDDPSVRFRALKSLFRMLSENFGPEAVPSVLGTMRERTIREVTGNPDPYADVKRISNERALAVLPMAEKIISTEASDEKRFRKACLSSIVGNVMEFGIVGHKFSFDDLETLLHNAEEDLIIDDTPEAFGIAKESPLILYLTDNAGEIAFDTLFVRELKKIGAQVIVAVKDKPVFNDATMEDAKYVGMHETADSVITTGTDTMGLSLPEGSKEFLSYYDSADFVVAKGMAYAESITEIDIKTPHLLLLRTKCPTVARYFGIERNRNVAKLLAPFNKGN